MKKHLYAKLQANFDHHIAKIISAVNANKKKMSHSTAHGILTTSDTSFEMYKRHVDDQEKLPGGLFEPSKQLEIFKHNFKISMHGRTNWRRILHMLAESSIKFVLTNFMLIDEADLMEARKKHSLDKTAAAKNMYIAL
eukprot:776694-Ditylum_brightwellii.AAC.1